MCAGAIAGDLVDVIPGPLTIHPVAVRTFDDPRGSYASGQLVRALEEGPAVDANAVNALADAFAASQGVGADYSLIVADAQGNAIVDRNGSAVREPASTMKTLTAFAATRALDMDSTLDTSTRLVYDAATQKATVTLTGEGNMLLGTGASDLDHVNGRAGLGTLAAQTADALRARGITRVSLVYDDSLFGSDRTPPGIEQNNAEHRYATDVSSMAVDSGRNWTGMTKPSDPDSGHVYPPMSTTTAHDAASVFAARLREQGVTVDGEPVSGATPEGVSPIATVHSATLGEIMTYMLRNSDNTEAELFGRLVGLRTGAENSPAGAASAVRAQLEQADVPLDGLHMADCSGLSPGSQLAANTLIHVQEAIMASPSSAAANEGLPVSGLTGTARTRSFTSDAKGLVRLKTGSLTGVRSMAGNISRVKGGMLYFAVIVNNSQDTYAANEAIDKLVSGLVNL
nr:D-alanyl-D-alanine carboxypeptidase/D-alanyl-D-alanine-endopeptidase [Bifidobacterium avesanii]